MDTATISAFAAAAAAIGAFTVAGIQLYVGYRQSKAALKQAEAATISARTALMSAENSGRHAVATFRQKWIDALRDTMAAYHALTMTISEYPYPEDKDRQLSELGTKIELLLNPTETPSHELLRVMSEIYDCPNLAQRIEMDPKLVAATQAILKAEWKRVKAELDPSKSV